ncbi:MAG: adenylate/guanylate cyclase domain-containing protein [Rhodospirillales bacterium]|nr:MAG: adenylate/guanylate cyclase domain-containing protein [Rhodospirillales bacterium]
MTEWPKRGSGGIARRIAEGFAREARSGIRHATIARSATLVCFMGWVAAFQQFPRAWFYIGMLGLLLVLGLAQGYVASRVAPRIWPSALFILADSIVIAIALTAPNPFVAIPAPPPVALRSGNFSLYYVLLAGSLLSYSPRLVLWCGATAAAAWGVAVAWVASLPESRTLFEIGGWQAMEPGQHMPYRMDPYFVTLPQHLKEILIFVAVTIVLATVVRRVRLLAIREAEIERERTNLARHFSPNMVDTLARSEESLDAVRKQNAAVLFADIVGFSGLAEGLGSERTMEVLRRVHSMISDQVFAHDGTLDKFIGDAVMATFGVPLTSDRDAANAVACALSIQAVLARSNPLPMQPLRVGIGVHYGEVVMGNLGGPRRLEYGVIGDTVNVASRLEGLTREFGATIVLSDHLVRVALDTRGFNPTMLDGFEKTRAQPLHGRHEPIDIWVLKSPERKRGAPAGDAIPR